MHFSTNSENNYQFAKWLLEVGNGTNSIDNKILLSEFMKILSQNLNSLIDAIFPNISRIGVCNDQYLSEQTILSPRNEDVEYINQEILNMFPGNQCTYFSADKALIEEGADCNTIYPTEFLNTLNPNGMPLSKLNLKIGCPIILLRNIAPGEGLCNRNHTFIPCITLTLSTSELPFIFKRRQFPIRVAFGMTINKSQGQLLKYIGLNLQTPVFTHSQLYVALSRSTSPYSIKVLFPQDNIDTTTTNIVYPKALIPNTYEHKYF
ncbi:22080_t:CDS:2 [Gigaspora margarita]|uniref:22080_t:CDS:1 n=1 Tax=Gigaspora margarita TaxID=4874 RepID=A0ABM8W3L6_GIGMA|nr:22080_t:CDS:2 [Gigaspora margarita]